jgi:hypothetical protein
MSFQDDKYYILHPESRYEPELIDGEEYDSFEEAGAQAWEWSEDAATKFGGEADDYLYEVVTGAYIKKQWPAVKSW